MLTPEVPAELAADQESAESMIRARGVRVTASRVAVLRAVNELPHADADTLTQAVRNRLGAVSTQAVYDALALFKQLGLVRRIEPAGSPARFETRVETTTIT
ncbi:transcriptional repressor [Ornithinimicrobium sp. INDO-MA30-4]|uniref:Fur family transcriptional regulator n=1 Tax=Ornithinimicrobium sp. INDO-MA30-4 TaxID=2908651 RepID=UPI002882EC14|nr:transcriptional repressor [Ornithinimicrobium sp. INDO-MA30-4]